MGNSRWLFIINDSKSVLSWIIIQSVVAYLDGIKVGQRKNTTSFSNPLDLWIVLKTIPLTSSEKIFEINGIGGAYLDAFNGNDYNLIMVIMAFYTVIGLATTLIVDLSYGFIDPRIRMGAGKNAWYR